MEIKRIAAVAATGLALAVVPLSGASANPANTCGQLGNLDLTRGACASTIAQNRGVTDPDQLKPSNAAYIANCKVLEKNRPGEFGFLEYDESGKVVAGPYPHQFYKGMLDDVDAVAEDFELPPFLAQIVVKNYLANKARFTAKNRAGCVTVLKGLHGGELFGLLFQGFPEGPAA